jgi:prepilin-type N-terminal cleavage/methylation domain-containing protein
MNVNDNKQKGFTIIELVIAIGIFTVITSLITINLVNVQHIASIDSTATTLVADLKQQQLKAMTGDTEGRGIADQYGIHFDVKQYVLFHGSYDPAGTSNFVVDLEGTLSFTGITGDGNIIFSQGSGESFGLSTIILKDDLTNKQKIITANIYGVITYVN